MVVADIIYDDDEFGAHSRVLIENYIGRSCYCNVRVLNDIYFFSFYEWATLILLFICKTGHDIKKHILYTARGALLYNTTIIIKNK